MKQQRINLLPKIPVRSAEYLSAKILLLSWGSLILILGVVISVLWGLTIISENSLKKINTENQTIRVQIAAIKQSMPEVQSDLKAAAQKLQFTEESKIKTELINKLKEIKRSGSAKGFSAYLKTFAEVTPQGIWLNSFSFEEGGNKVSVAGTTEESSLVPEFMHVLGKTSVFSHVKFEILDLSKAKDKKETNFVIETVKK